MQKLSKRLQAAADFVTVHGCVADIGTDHGYLPIYLVQSGRCKRAIAMDIGNGPLERAIAHIAQANLEARIQVRLSDGIKQLQEGEADSIVIAGMGGLTIIKILTDRLSFLSGIQEFVLAPQSDIGKVRAFLRQHKLYIDKETLVYEDGKFYPVMHAGWEEPAYRKEHSFLQKQALLQEKLTDTSLRIQMLDQYGEYMLYHANPVLVQLLERDIAVKRNILCTLTNQTPSEPETLFDSLGSQTASDIPYTQQKKVQRRQELEEQVKGMQVLLQISSLSHT